MRQNITFGEIGNGELLDLVNDELRKLVQDLRNPEKLAASNRTAPINQQKFDFSEAEGN